MKKSGAWILIVITSLFAGFLGGMLVGRNISADSVQVSPLLQETEATVSATSYELSEPTTAETTSASSTFL